MVSRHWVRPGDLLPGILDRWNACLESPIHEVIELWGRVMGADVARHAEPIALRGGLLLVAVDDAVWAAELARFRRREIVDALNRALGRDDIRDVRFTTGDRPGAGEVCDNKGVQRKHEVRRDNDNGAGGR